MMDPGALLKTFIYLISSSLLDPVLLMLSILVLLIIAYAEWLERIRLQSCPGPGVAPTCLKPVMHQPSSPKGSTGLW